MINELDNLKPLADVPPAGMDEFVSRLPLGIRNEYAKGLDAVVQWAAWRKGYFEARYGEGTDQGHEKAVAWANKRLARVRTALGYSYPASAAIYV